MAAEAVPVDYQAKYEAFLREVLKDIESKVQTAQQNAEENTKGKVLVRSRHQHPSIQFHLSHTVSEQYCHELKLQLSQSTKLVEELQERLAATEAELQTAKEQLQDYEGVKVVSS